ncbi:16S rRNA (uracil(1498)-N(3))-methyltransferase [Parvularcula sp. IMCC14364]|uniref:16S rRNA (uracil(1498)-N(3))-methyltransferase n=1 Tax=Parvularcula sp. IMCC14364 TaxID=3067902 RepID=UPI0027427462|nr:16S rRNA (uracil(1498)-N(3))-methyltransferase [Parvularcula sp. IMCC14364]
MLRLFVSSELAPGISVPVSPEQAHYLGRVMRRDIGAELLLFNGRDGEWRGEIAAISKNAGVVSLKEQTRVQAATPDLWLLFAPVKRVPLDQIAQKTTELGASLLQPVKTARTIVTRVREDRLYANAVEAAEQSERLDVPEVRPFAQLEKLVTGWPDNAPERRLVFCDEAGDDAQERWGGPEGRALPMVEALQAYRDKSCRWAILTGPEGGFTPAERDMLRQQEFVTPVTLGPRIMRADTAAFAAVTLWQAVLGDLGQPFTKA